MEKRVKQFALGLGLLMLMMHQSSGKWIQTNGPVDPSAISVDAIATLNSNVFISIGSHGIFLSNDNGNTWQAVDSGLPRSSNFSLAVSGSNIFAWVAPVSICLRIMALHGLWPIPGFHQLKTSLVLLRKALSFSQDMMSPCFQFCK